MKDIKSLIAVVNNDISILVNAEDNSVSLDDHIQHNIELLNAFNELEPAERYELCTTVDQETKRNVWDRDILATILWSVKHAIHSFSVSEAGVTQHLIDGEKAIILSYEKGEVIVFPKYDNFGCGHFDPEWPICEESALACKHLAMMTQGLGGLC